MSLETKTLWRGRDGTYELKDMETSHIINCMCLLKNRMDTVDSLIVGWGKCDSLIQEETKLREQLDLFFAELVRREMQ